MSYYDQRGQVVGQQFNLVFPSGESGPPFPDALLTSPSDTILLDQLDALSLALTRERTTLDILLSTLARLRNLNGVRIVASCRGFDIQNDPRLSTITRDRQFPVAPLGEEQVNTVLQAIGIDPARLLPAHRTLLTIPLHLDVYARIVADNAPTQPLERFHTLQDLYAALWRKRVATVPPDTPSPTARIAAIYRLVDAMQQHRQVAVPLAVLDEHAEAAAYLERVGWIRRVGHTWLCLHQTLFDYCYARHFVAQGHSLSQVILAGPQGFFERSQMVQILAYLRGTDPRAYHRELTALLGAQTLRVHLHLLLLGWFGSLPDPSTDELSVARRLLHDTNTWQHFLRAAGGNEHWFSVLSPDVLPALLRTGDAQRITTTTAYLSTLLQHCPQPVLALLRPHLGHSAPWDDAIAYCLSQLKDWQYDVGELAFAFTAQVKNAPERFYRLSQRFDDAISLRYIAATIIGLAESNAPAQWVFEVVRRFAARLQGESRLDTCRALGNRAADSVPDDLLEMMSEWALYDPDPTAELWEMSTSSGVPYYGGDPHSQGINTNRGTALQAVCTCALLRQPPQAERAFQLLERAASDPSTAVRACVIESLRTLLKEDAMRTLVIFERTVTRASLRSVSGIGIAEVGSHATVRST